MIAQIANALLGVAVGWLASKLFAEALPLADIVVTIYGMLLGFLLGATAKQILSEATIASETTGFIVC